MHSCIYVNELSNNFKKFKTLSDNIYYLLLFQLTFFNY